MSNPTTKSKKKILIIILPSTISLVSNYLCFVNIGKRVDSIEIFIDELASSVSQLDNIFNQLNDSELNIEFVKNFEISLALYRKKDAIYSYAKIFL